MTDWKPVSTAPRGVNVLGFYRRANGEQCIYVGRFNGRSFIPLPMGPYALSYIEFTHWMPLPEPPAIDGVPSPSNAALPQGVETINIVDDVRAQYERTLETVVAPPCDYCDGDGECLSLDPLVGYTPCPKCGGSAPEGVKR